MPISILALMLLLSLPVIFWGNHVQAGEFIVPKQMRLGVLNTLRGVDHNDALVAVEMNFDRLTDNYNPPNPDFRVKLEFLPDADAAARMIRKRELHALTIGVVDFLLLRKMVNVNPLLVSSKLATAPTEPFLLVARKSLTLKALATSGQRRIILEDKDQWDIGRIWLETVLAENGLPDSARFFTSVQSAAKPIRMVLPVFFGQADVCLVPQSAFNTMVELNPQIGKKLSVMLRSPAFVKDLICTPAYLDPGFAEEMQEAVINMHTREAGRQVLLIFQLQRNFAFQPEFLVDTERVFRQYEKLKLAR